MAEQQILMRNTQAGIEKETVEGTLATETNASAVLIREDGLEVNIGRELLEVSIHAPARGATWQLLRQ